MVLQYTVNCLSLKFYIAKQYGQFFSWIKHVLHLAHVHELLWIILYLAPMPGAKHQLPTPLN